MSGTVRASSFLREGGIEVGILSSRSSRAVSRRARELGIRLVRQGIKDKGTELAAISKRKKLSGEEIAFLGDDWADLPVFRRVGLAIAVADSIPELKRAAHFVTDAPGGRGAVREAAEAILKAQGKWAQITKKYLWFRKSPSAKNDDLVQKLQMQVARIWHGRGERVAQSWASGEPPLPSKPCFS